MPVNDSPDTRVKAADAKPFLGVGDPLEASRLTEALIAREGLKALVVIETSGARPILLASAPGDKRGGAILHEWITKTFPALPTLRKAAVIVAIHADGVIDTATWGADRFHCAEAGRWADKLAEHFYHAPFQTWFGFGSGGAPTKLSKAQLETLTPKSRDWVAKHTHPDAEEA